ncbi:MAG: stalk domain-containing protein [Bacillota bacterium]
MRTRPWLVAVTSLALLASLVPGPTASAAAPVHVILDGKRLDLSPAPVIQNSRALVPLRGVFEAMGAAPHWDGAARTVEVRRGNRYVKLQIDRSLACLNALCTDAAMLDVPATLIDNRTYVPIRFISTALGVRVSWDDAQRAVVIETDKSPIATVAPFRLQGVWEGQTITGPVSLSALGANGGHIFFYLVDPATRKARVIATGANVHAAYTYTPDPTQTGTRHIVAAWRDPNGGMRYSDAVTVNVRPNTKLALTGIEPGGVITGPITLGHQLNFVATSVWYQLVNPTTGEVTNLATVGPGDSFTWYPPVSLNGQQKMRVVAYDRAEREYASVPVSVTVASGHRTVFSAIKEGESLNARGRTLNVAANYEIASVRYLLDGKVLSTQKEYWWAFGPESNGNHSLTVEVTDTAGVVRTAGPVNFAINTRPTLWLNGVGPKQVVTGQVSLIGAVNVPADEVRFFLQEGGQTIPLGERRPGETFNWTPASSGQKTIYAQAFRHGQWVLSSEPVTFQAHLGRTYAARPIVARTEFKDWVSTMAVKSHQETGMSASLQVAQAILETGWGQYVPVDKYTGQFSNNLFGMKGKGTAGSILSTTWEVYNGQRYVVDDYFRAYHNVEENWRDHKDLLLTRSWYAPFRAVMADPVLGAWGLKRSGYATDPQYPIKLITLMKQHNLFQLDEVEL